jgi:predicted 2-oxoglutarate/Fe(II)-dependent dioxygenase YbiX
VNLRQLAGDRIFVIDEFFSPVECADAIAHSERAGYDDAPLTTLDGPVMDKTVRNNTRVIIDDPAFAGHIWERLRPFVASPMGDWEAIGLNERFRYYRYDIGERFAPHFDGAFQRSASEISALTFMVYLNDGFEGGETIFCWSQEPLVVRPTTGMALLFRHRQLHEGAPVRRGRKYVLRSDVMYRDRRPRK